MSNGNPTAGPADFTQAADAAITYCCAYQNKNQSQSR